MTAIPVPRTKHPAWHALLAIAQVVLAAPATVARRSTMAVRGTRGTAPSVVDAGRSLRLVNDHHVDFPRFAGDMPF